MLPHLTGTLELGFPGVLVNQRPRAKPLSALLLSLLLGCFNTIQRDIRNVTAQGSEGLSSPHRLPQSHPCDGTQLGKSWRCISGVLGGMWSLASPTFTAGEENPPEEGTERGALCIPPCPRCPCQPAGSQLMDSCRQQI